MNYENFLFLPATSQLVQKHWESHKISPYRMWSSQDKLGKLTKYFTYFNYLLAKVSMQPALTHPCQDFHFSKLHLNLIPVLSSLWSRETDSSITSQPPVQRAAVLLERWASYIHNALHINQVPMSWYVIFCLFSGTGYRDAALSYAGRHVMGYWSALIRP